MFKRVIFSRYTPKYIITMLYAIDPPLPWDDLRFSNTTGILQKKKKLCGLLVLK